MTRLCAVVPNDLEDAMFKKTLLLALVCSSAAASSVSADAISDWNEKAVAFVLARGMGPPPAERVMAMTHVAMFDAVNTIERRYRPYLVQVPAAATASQPAAAATAAGMVLAGVAPQTMIEMRTT